LEFVCLAWSKWFPVITSDHEQNLVISLWPRDKATINGVAAQRLTLPPKFRVIKSAGKVLASIFWDQDSILLNDYLPKG
jgi:hypothetical protein